MTFWEPYIDADQRRTRLDRALERISQNSEYDLFSYSESFWKVVKTIAAIIAAVIAVVFVGKACYMAGQHIYKWVQPLVSSSISKVPLSR